MSVPATLCFLGPMIGRNPGYVTTQEQIMADLFSATEHPVIWASGSTNRYRRLVEIPLTVIRHRRRIDLVHLSVYGVRSFVVEDAASFVCKILGIPLVMTLHSGRLPAFMERRPNWVKRVLRRADRLSAPSHHLVEVAAQYGFQVQMIPNILNLDDYQYRQRTSVQPKLFWMRSFGHLYYPEMAVYVLKNLLQDYPEARLVMGGQDRGLMESTRALAVSEGVGNRAEIWGFIDKAGKTRANEACDIYINTNQVDNMPVGVLEAGAMGMPVVATNVGGIPYLLTHEQTGLLVPTEDIEAMANAIRRLVQTPELAAHLSANGRLLAERSSWTQIRPVWEAVYQEVIEAKRRS